MADTKKINVIIGGNARGLKDASKQAQGSMNKLSGTASKMGGVLAGAFGGAVIIAGIGRAISKIAEFESTMRRVSLISKGSEKELTNLARTLGGSTSFTATQAGEAMTFLAQAGFKVNEILKATPGVLQLAGSTMIDLGTAADIASNVLSAYGIEASKINEVNDLLVTTTNNSNTSVTQFAEAFKVVGPVAKGAGISINEVAGAIGVLGDAGLQGSLAGTQIKTAISKLINPSNEAAAILEKLGVKTKGAGGQLRALTDIFKDLGKAGMTAEESFVIFDQRAASGALVMAEYAGKIGDLAEQTKEAGVAAEQYRKQQDTLTGDIKAGESAWESLTLEGGKFNLMMRQVTQDFTSLIMAVNGTEASLGQLENQLSVLEQRNEKLSKSWLGGIGDGARMRDIEDLKIQIALMKAEMEESGPVVETFAQKLERMRDAGQKATKAVNDQTLANLSAAEASDVHALAVEYINNKLKAQAVAVEVARIELEKYNAEWAEYIGSKEGEAAPEAESAQPDDPFVSDFNPLANQAIVIKQMIQKHKELKEELKKLDAEAGEIEREMAIELAEDIKEQKLAIAIAGMSAALMFMNAMDALARNNMNKELKAAGDNEKKKDAIRAKYAKKEKKRAIIQSIINTALAVTAGLAQGGPVLAAINGVLGAIQTGIIASQQFARGTSFAPGGMALVGERGPEMVNLPRGSKVTPNHLMGSGNSMMIPDVRIKGEDIYIVFKEAERKLNNTRG